MRSRPAAERVGACATRARNQLRTLKRSSASLVWADLREKMLLLLLVLLKPMLMQALMFLLPYELLSVENQLGN